MAVETCDTKTAPVHSLSESADPNDENRSIVRRDVKKEICKQVLRKKLSKQRHLVLNEAIVPAYLDSIFPEILRLFHPQTVNYNGGIAKIKEWKISCYIEVMEGGIPTAEPNLELLKVMTPLLESCDDIFMSWYRQKSSCNRPKLRNSNILSCKRLMTFVTRYTPNPGEEALLKVGSFCTECKSVVTTIDEIEDLIFFSLKNDKI